MALRDLGFWSGVALRFYARSGRTTLVLSFMVVSAVATLIFLSALAVGVNDAMIRNTTGLFSGHITGFDLSSGEVRPGDLAGTGVEGVLVRVRKAGILSHGSLGQPIDLFGVEPERESVLTAFDKKIVQGRHPLPGQPEILISQSLARAFGTGTGQSLKFVPGSGGEPMPFTVSGIYRTGIEMLDRGLAFCPLDRVRMPDTPWTAAVFLKQGTDAGRTADRYRERWQGRYRFASWTELMPDLKQLIDLEYLSMGIVIILVFGVVSTGIAGAFVIFIIKNIREYGIMKAMGVTGREMALLILMKVAVMSGIACTAGILAGISAVWAVAVAGGIDISAMTSHNPYFTVSGIIIPRLTWFSLWTPPTAGLVFILIAAAWPAVLVARRRAADIIRMI